MKSVSYIICYHNGVRFYLCNKKDKLFTAVKSKARKYTYENATKLKDEINNDNNNTNVFLSFSYPPKVWTSGAYQKQVTILTSY